VPVALTASLPKDPRLFQLAFLGSFLGAGFLILDFDCPWWQPLLLLGVALPLQAFLAWRAGLADLGLRSAAISALGLSLLLRTDVWWVLPFSAVVAIGSKFLVRTHHKHIFNPTNLGLAVAMMATRHAWCSPSQWGENALLLAWFFAPGRLMVALTIGLAIFIWPLLGVFALGVGLGDTWLDWRSRPRPTT